MNINFKKSCGLVIALICSVNLVFSQNDHTTVVGDDLYYNGEYAGRVTEITAEGYASVAYWHWNQTWNQAINTCTNSSLSGPNVYVSYSLPNLQQGQNLPAFSNETYNNFVATSVYFWSTDSYYNYYVNPPYNGNDGDEAYLVDTYEQYLSYQSQGWWTHSQLIVQTYLPSENNLVAGEWDQTAVHPFYCLGTGVPIQGCTNFEACNYDSNAVLDDDSCVLLDGICDECSADGESVVDYDADNDGQCDILDTNFGCTDETACNYDATPYLNPYIPSSCITPDMVMPAAEFSVEYSKEKGGILLMFDLDPLIEEIQIFKGNDVHFTGPVTSAVLDKDGDTYEYLDSDALENCTTVTYKIATIACANEDFNTTKVTAPISLLVNIDINDTWVENSPINSTKQLEANTGDYKDRVELNWSNNNNSLIHNFEIQRRIASDNNISSDPDYGFVKIGEVSNSIHHYIDLYTEANTLYEYRIDAMVSVCSENNDSEDIFSAKKSNNAIGFRSPCSNIFGQITFDETSPVENAEVFASTTNPMLNKSINLRGTNGLSISCPETLFSFMAWIKPDTLIGTYSPILARGNSFNFGINAQGFLEWNNGNTADSDRIIYGNTLSEGWNQISVSFEENVEPGKFNLRVYLNGESALNEAPPSESEAQGFFQAYKNAIISNSAAIVFAENAVQEQEIALDQEILDSLDANYSGLQTYVDLVSLQNTLNNTIEELNVVIGKQDSNGNFFSGFMDEISLWNISLSEEFIQQNFNKYLKRQEVGMHAYFHCDEGVGNTIYDCSINEEGLFNNLNARMLNSADNFNSNVPSAEQVRYSALSDQNGYYTLEEIRFASTGSNYQITPTLSAKYGTNANGSQVIIEPAHQFTPTYQTSYLGDGVDYISNINFNDNSSFNVSGNVYYLDPSKADSLLCDDSDGAPFSLSSDVYITNCDTGIPKVAASNSSIGVEGAFIFVDNEPVFDSSGIQIKTNSSGEFSVKVPIGKHQISIAKEDHTFVSNVWNGPSHTRITLNENTENVEVLSVYNFITEKQGITFFDNTKRRLVGRVCGGTTEATKLYDGSSVNNIGVADFTLQNQGAELHSVAVSTNSNSGEYSIDLLPLSYEVKSDATVGRLFTVPSQEVGEGNLVNDFFLEDMGNGQPYPFGAIDLSQKGNQYSYSQAFYDNIVSNTDINEFGYRLILNPNFTQYNGVLSDSIQTLADSVLQKYHAFINNPNTIEIREDASSNDPDDYYLYPHLFGINHTITITHDAVLAWQSNPIEYDWAENFVYRVTPSISYYSSKYDFAGNGDSLEILGESEWNLLNQQWNEEDEVWIEGETIVIPLINSAGLYQIGNPVFKQEKAYKIFTSVEEIYTKYQISESSIVSSKYTDPVRVGTLTLNDGTNSNSYPMTSSETIIPFEAMYVNTSLNGDNSFEKSFTITYSDGALSINENNDYYVFGTRVDEGLNFFSSGPEVVEMVLRDPPGDESYSYIESGSSSINEVEIYSAEDVVSDHIVKDINLGFKMQIAVPFGGPIFTTELIANTQIDLIFESSSDTTETNWSETSSGQTYRTSSQEFNIGSGGDLYIANNYNIVYGTNKLLEVVKLADCGLQGFVCLGETSETPALINEFIGAVSLYTQGDVAYTLGTSVGLEIVPVGFKTKTVYDQNHIVKTLIPTLEWLRNTYFGIQAVYTFTDPSDPCYNNEAHLSYSDLNKTPCYTYHESADVSDPYELPFNVFEDINIADYVPSGFVGLVEEALLASQTNGAFNSFSEETLNTMNSVAAAAGDATSVLNAIGEIADSQFWSDFASIIGGQNLLLGMQTFKSEVIDSYAETLSGYTDGLELLITVLDNMTYTPPTDKVAFYNEQITLWKAAVEANEKDKATIFDDSGSQSAFVPEILITETFGPDQNYSFSGGNVIEETIRQAETSQVLNTINYSIDGHVAYEIGGKINNFGGSHHETIPITFEVEKNITNTESSYMGFGYVLSDNDESDYISVDVKKSNSGWGPIFRKRAGQTMCPHEAEEPFLYYVHDALSADENVFAPATQPREVPGIDINPTTLSGVPETQAAVFTLSLTNNSASTEDMVYTLMVDEASNPYGAIMQIDGQFVHRDIMVPYGETINKTLTINKGPEQLVYMDSSDLGGNDDRLGLILRSSCQYSYGTSNTPDIADTIYLSVSFLQGCTEISISQPSDSWILNKSSENTTGTVNDLNITLDGYDWNYYSLDDVILEYKKSTQPDYNEIETFTKVEEGATLQDSDTELSLGSVNLVWDMYNLEDGDYDIRAYTNCGGASFTSEVHSGHKDTRLPEPFGSAQPADGILSPNDEIQMNWSEALDENRFYSQQTTITMSAIKNMSEVSHDAFVYMDSGSSLEIPYGLNIQHSSFTVEMWINPKTTGTIFQQGYDNNRLSLFLNEDRTLGIQYEEGNSSILASSHTALALATESAEAWQHIAFVFDNDLKTISFIIGGELLDPLDISELIFDYIAEGPISIGSGSYQGAMHELRVWSTNKYATSIYQNLGVRLSGREAGLIGHWPMDELSGNPKDLARSRHMSGEVNWAVAKKGFGYNFSSNSTLNAPFGTKAYEATDDFTMEFWFKSNNANGCMVSTGSYKTEQGVGNLDAWSIGLDNGYITIDHNLNNNSTLLMNSSEQFNDDVWHHLAIVKNAKSTTTLFIDGIEQASCSSEMTRGFGSPELTLGAKQYQNSVGPEYSDHFTGKMDEFRLWNLKRDFSQLDRYKNIRLNGTELGLDAYYPFEQYEITQGVSLLTASYSDNSDTLNLELDPLSIDYSYESSDLPLVRMSNPYLGVFHNSLVNQDQTLLSITEDLANVEGTIVDVSMDNLFDIYGNKANPVTWSFYVDKNQLVWNQNTIDIHKLLGEPMVFETSIVNNSGAIENFEITNLPTWLSANPTEGLLSPNSYTEIQFVVNDNLFIGDYRPTITLTGNNGVPEQLNVDLNVEASQPEFLFNGEEFQYDMSFIGKVSVDEIRSRDELDILFAYVNDEIRGYASPVYIEEYDAYFIFLSIHSNQQENEQVNFRLWDASEGKIQSQVTMNETIFIPFIQGNVVGDFNILAHFNANNVLRQEIPLNVGWNWFSLNLMETTTNQLNTISIPTVVSYLEASEIQSFKNQTSFTQYYNDSNNSTSNWFGSMTTVDLGGMYMIKMGVQDTIVYDGLRVDLSNPVYNIPISQGWNWIGYLGQRPLGTNHALSSMNPSSGDLIKGKTSFSMYASESLGWLGTLNTLSDGEGYMYKSLSVDTLVYPEISLYGSGDFRLNQNCSPSERWPVLDGNYEHSMSLIAKIDHPNYSSPTLKNILGAFINEDCIGNISCTPIEGQESLYFVTIHGNSQALVSFKYFDHEKNKSYDATNRIEFEANKMLGSIENPYLIQIDLESQDAGNYFELNVYPNPFNNSFELEFILDKEVEVEIHLYDVMGRLIETISEPTLMQGIQHIQIDGKSLNKGVYFLELKVDDKAYKKMIVKS